MFLMSRRFLLPFVVSCILMHRVAAIVTSLCPNQCSGHGNCQNTSAGLCECFPSYTGFDCSLRVCPSSTAWVDAPSRDNVAHAEYTECSNMGVCDRSTGICQCRTGFSGAACDRILCPLGLTPTSLKELSNDQRPCSSTGRCVSLRDVTRYQTFESYLSPSYYSGWDADKIFGCVCDEGWSGVNCGKRVCPKGDDPVTTGVDEVQLLDCECTTCSGGLYLSFKGQQTPFIPYDASEELIEYHLNRLTTVTRVRVKILNNDRMCSREGSLTRITFELPQGPQPTIGLLRSGRLSGAKHPIVIHSKGAFSIIDGATFGTRSVTGSRELVECSNRGICQNSTGTCSCFDGFRSSDGRGGPGTIGDCGFRFQQQFNYTIDAALVTTSCPVISGDICAGHGTCDELTGICACDSDYGGPGCANRTCATAFSWWGQGVTADHSYRTECGGVGDCNSYTGQCVNCGGSWGIFEGSRCQQLACPKNETGSICSDNGACLTMREIAQLTYNEQKELAELSYSEPWDADLIRGCSCYRAISVDNRFDLDYTAIIGSFFFNNSNNATSLFTDQDLIKFYRGPYAFAATDFKGYACQSASCPKGDDPRTFGVNEIQAITCRSNNGSFLLTFRENTTTPIDYNATVAEFKTQLEQLYTIGSVAVTAEGGEELIDGLLRVNPVNGSICNEHGNTTVLIEFLTEFGDLPLMVPDFTLLDPTGEIAALENNFLFNITEYQKGTKEDIECSAQGVCNESSGVCSCFDGFTSSDGTVDTPGERGDCTHFNKFYTQKFVRGR